MAFKDRLRLLIDRKDVSVYRVAQDTGISQQLLAKYLNRDLVPKQDKLIALASYLDASEIWLRTGCGDVSMRYGGDEDTKTLECLAGVPALVAEACEALGIKEDEEVKKYLDQLTSEFHEQDKPQPSNVNAKKIPLETKQPLNREERLLAIIESQQWILLSQQRTIESLEKRLK